MNRQKLLLAILVLLLVAAIAYAFLRSPHQERVATLKNRQGAVATTVRKRVAPAARPVSQEGRVNLALLDREPPRSAGYRRNIFAPIFREEVKMPPFRPLPLPPPPKALPLPPPPGPIKPLSAPAKPPPPPPPPTPEQIANAELARFTFLGFLNKDGVKTVFLTSNNEIFLVKKGSTVAGKYLVTNLNDEALTITTVTGGGELVIPLVENSALSTRRRAP